MIADSSKISVGTKVTLNGQVKKLDGTVIQSFAESGVVNSKILSQLSFGSELFDQKTACPIWLWEGNRGNLGAGD